MMQGAYYKDISFGGEFRNQLSYSFPVCFAVSRNYDSLRCLSAPQSDHVSTQIIGLGRGVSHYSVEQSLRRNAVNTEFWHKTEIRIYIH
jgi:hypothetical protein